MTTAQQLIDAIVECGRVLDEQEVPEPRFIIVPTWWVRLRRKVLGLHVGKHRRSRSGLRGRKKTLMRCCRPGYTGRRPTPPNGWVAEIGGFNVYA